MNATIQAMLILVAAYLVGSTSSAWLVIKLLGHYDMRHEPDGTISAAAVYRRLGAAPYALATLMDIAIGATVVLLAQAITHSTPLAMLAGFVAMAGHNWSLYLRFKGGQGATSMAGALLAVMPIPLLIGASVAFFASRITHSHSKGTVIGVLCISLAGLVKYGPGLYTAYPLGLLSLMFLKRLQLMRSGHGSLRTAK
jgi:acyl phosphate:glycerol-3-phosphate acyltransferase